MGLVQLHNLRHSGSTMQSSKGELAGAQVRTQIFPATCSSTIQPGKKRHFFPSAGDSSSNKSQLSPGVCLLPCMKPQQGISVSCQQEGKTDESCWKNKSLKAEHRVGGALPGSCLTSKLALAM